jgi:hypothetical protein
VVRAVLASTALSATRTGDDIEEIIVCGAYGYHLLALVGEEFDGPLLVHLWLDYEKGNLGLARLKVQSLVHEMVGS